MSIIGTLRVRLAAEMDRFKADLGSAADATDKAAQKIDSSNKAMQASVQRTTAVLEAGTPANTSAAASIDKVGMSAKATAAALRGVPAQFTDIITSLQGGQAPLTVFMQQGGQLKDMFGGAGNAAKALGGYVMGLVNPMTVAAAAGAVVALAYYQGSKEATAYEKSIALTGNAAGVTAGQMQDMAKNIGAVAGTQGAAAAVLAQIAGSGQVAGRSLERLTTIALDMERNVGVAVEDTVKDFVKLGEAPVEASAKLNKQYNYLTTAVYEQIKALQSQGKVVEAATLAQTTYGDAMDKVSKTMEGRLGYIERAWRGVKDAAADAWDSMLDIGRPRSSTEKISGLQTALARKEELNATLGIKPGKATQDLKDQINLLQEQDRMLRRGAEAQAQNAQAQKEGIAAVEAVSKANATAASKTVQMNKALEDYRKNIAAIKTANPSSDLLDPKKIAAAEAGIRAQFAEKSSTRERVDENARLIASVRESVAATMAETDAAQKLTPVQQMVAKLYEEIDGSKKKYTLQTLLAVDATMQEALAAEAANTVREAGRKATEQANKERQQTLDGLAKETSALADQIRKQQDHNESIGKNAEAIASLTAQRELDKASALENQAIKDLDRNLDYQLYDSTMDRVRAMRTLAAEQAKGGVLQTAFDAAKKADAEWTKFYDSLYTGLTDSLYRAFEKGGSFFQSLWDGIKNTFKTTVLKLAIQGVVGGITGTSSAASAAGGGSGVMGLASNASSLYSAATGNGLLGNALSYAGVYSGFGAAAGSAAVVAAGEAASAAALAAGASAASAAAAAGAAAGVAATGTTTLAAASGPLASMGPVGWAALAAVAVASIFGGRGAKESTGGGIEGSFGAGAFSGNTFSTWQQDGGWFHSDRSGKETGALDAVTQKAYTTSFAALQSAATVSAAALGLSADAITSYSQEVSLQLGSDAAANEKAVMALFQGIADSLATAVAPGLAALSKDGETASSTLQRVSTNLTTTNSWLSMLRQRLLQVSLAGGEAASQLVDAFGGLEAFTSATKAFYDTYYTEGERLARSQDDMAKALAMVNVTMPTTKDGLRALASSLDLNTASGRAAYTVLLSIAPEFAAAADAAARFASETAQKLVTTFTGGGALVPALDVSRLRLDALTASTGQTGAAAGYVSSIFLDSNSKLLGFGNTAGGLAPVFTAAQLSAQQLDGQMGALSASTGQASAVAGNAATIFYDSNNKLWVFGNTASGLAPVFTAAQLSAQQLNGQIDALHAGADRTRIDFAGLADALQHVDTETFVNIIALVFTGLATRISAVLGDINTERIAVREAALQIINPTVMGKAAIQRSIASINTNLPSNAGVVNAQQGLASADRQAAAASGQLAAQRGALNNISDGILANQNWLSQTANARASESAYAQRVQADLNDLSNNRASAERDRLMAQDRAELARVAATMVELDKASAAANANIANLTSSLAGQQAVVAQAQAQEAQALAHQAAVAAWARNEQIAYASALQDFAIDASKSVGKLTRLREETVRYYEAQKALASLMGASASALRSTVADYKYSQLTPEQQFADLQTRYSTAYAMALSTDGETLAGYGDQLNGLLNPLLEKAKEVLGDSAYNTFAATMLARADNIAGRLEALTPTDYAADSLAMLGNIDATLAALDASSRSAEKIIADAVAAGADKTANGLRAVIAALTGQAIPAFANGGRYLGGMALVGERGPELINFDRGGQVYTAQQTRGILGGDGAGNPALVFELQALRRDNADMRIELRSIATSNAKLARLAERAEQDGTLVRTDADTPLATVAA